MIYERADNQREWLHVAWVAQFRKEPRFEIDALKKLLARQPDNVDLRYRLARLYDSIANLKLAEEEMKLVISHDPSNKTYQNYMKQLKERRLLPRIDVLR